MKRLFIALAALLLLGSCGSQRASHGEDFSPCTICGILTGIDELTDIGYNDEYLCKDCLENRTFLCDNCGRRYPFEAMMSENPTYCEFCFSGFVDYGADSL